MSTGVGADVRHVERERERTVRNEQAWTEVLDRLERDVEATEALVRTGTPTAPPVPAPWQPPELDGPLPDGLLERAREIHERQTAAKAALTTALAESRAQREQAQRPTRSARGTGAAAAYVDVSA